jgi:translation elongation factor EF-Tu-like GTPase
MSSKKERRDMPEGNICLLRHTSHGKTTSPAALATLSTQRFYESKDKVSVSQISNDAASNTPIEFETPHRRYKLYDCPSSSSDVKKMLTTPKKWTA